MLVDMTFILETPIQLGTFAYIIDRHQYLEPTPEVTERVEACLVFTHARISRSEHLSYAGLLVLR